MDHKMVRSNIFWTESQKESPAWGDFLKGAAGEEAPSNNRSEAIDEELFTDIPHDDTRA